MTHFSLQTCNWTIAFWRSAPFSVSIYSERPESLHERFLVTIRSRSSSFNRSTKTRSLTIGIFAARSTKRCGPFSSNTSIINPFHFFPNIEKVFSNLGHRVNSVCVSSILLTSFLEYSILLTKCKSQLLNYYYLLRFIIFFAPNKIRYTFVTGLSSASDKAFLYKFNCP